MAMTLNAQVNCGAPWLAGMSPAYGHVAAGASQPVQIRLNASGMPVGNHTAYYCVASNDLRTPVAGGVVTLNVAP